MADLSLSSRSLPERNAVSFFTSARIAAILVFVAAVLPYLSSLTGMAIWDDHALIEGTAIGGGQSLLACFTHPFLHNYYRPLVSVSFYLDHAYFGKNPFFYHQTNILLHLGATAALMGFLRTAFGSRRCALIGGTLFALQPAQVSTVAWIGGRTDSLGTFFLILFAWALVATARAQGRVRMELLCLSVLGFSAAIFTKEQLLPILLLVPLAFRCWAPETGTSRRRVALFATIPFVVITALYVGLYMSFGPKAPPMTSDGIGYIVPTFGRTVCYYSLLLLLPTTHWMHTMSLGAFVDKGPIVVLCGWGLIFFYGTLFVRWLHRAPAASWSLACAILPLLLVSNLYPVPSMLVCPYRAGAAGVGVAALLGWLLERGMRAFAWSRVQKARPLRQAMALGFWTASAAMMLWWTGLCFWGARQWEDELTVSKTFARSDPESLWSRVNLSAAQLAAQQPEAARSTMERTLAELLGQDAWQQPELAVSAITHNDLLVRLHAIQGTSVTPRQWLAKFYSHLGFADLKLQQNRAARQAFQTGSALYRDDAGLNAGLGLCAYRAKQLRTAAGYFRVSISEQPDEPEGHRLLGNVMSEQRQWRLAQTEYSRWVQLQPWMPQAYIELARAYAATGDIPTARVILEKAYLQSVCTQSEIQQEFAGFNRSSKRGKSGSPAEIPAAKRG